MPPARLPAKLSRRGFSRLSRLELFIEMGLAPEPHHCEPIPDMPPLKDS